MLANEHTWTLSVCLAMFWHNGIAPRYYVFGVFGDRGEENEHSDTSYLFLLALSPAQQT